MKSLSTNVFKPVLSSDLTLVAQTDNAGSLVLTMSSKEIAELTGKKHYNVLTDIRLMLSNLGITPLELTTEKPVVANKGVTVERYPSGQVNQYHLPKRECYILVSGYSVVLRAKIVDRWQELEEQASLKAIVLPDFTKPATAARAWADQYERAELATQEANKLAQ